MKVVYAKPKVEIVKEEFSFDLMVGAIGALISLAARVAIVILVARAMGVDL
jgi:hypothetical protein